MRFPEYVYTASKAYELMQAQARTGVCFDIEGARWLHTSIDNRMNQIEEEVNPQLPGRPLNIGEMRQWTPPKIQFKKDGTPSAACIKWFDEVKEVYDSFVHPCRDYWVGLKNDQWFELPWNEPVITTLPMTIKHQDAMKDWIMSLGWKPTLWNFKSNNTGPGKRQLARDDRGQLIKTSPKFHDKGRICPNLEKLGEKMDFIGLIVEWMSLRNRRSTIWNEDKDTGWLAHPRLKHDQRLPAASSGLTNTKRQKHTVVANVPRVGTLMGREMRSLFVAAEGMVMVGADASGLEARIKGHYTYPYDDGAYAKKLLDPNFDEHQENADLWGCERNDAKSPGYALQYNAQAPKFSETLGVPLKVGQKHYDAYWAANWSLRKAIEDTEREFERNFEKYITLIDGSKVVTRAKHSVFNAKCQGTGAKIMDMAGIIMDGILTDREIPAERIIYYHDEYQYQTPPEYAEEVGSIMCDAIKYAGQYFELNVPLAGEFKVGNNWAETH